MNDKQAALLILRALEAASVSRGRLLSRGRFSRLALRILWGRKYRPNPAAINDWLEPAGWTWMFDGETYFGVLRTSVIKDWPRISSSGLDRELAQIDDNTFDFGRLEYLLDPETWSKKRAIKPKTKKVKRK